LGIQIIAIPFVDGVLVNLLNESIEGIVDGAGCADELVGNQRIAFDSTDVIADSLEQVFAQVSCAIAFARNLGDIIVK